MKNKKIRIALIEPPLIGHKLRGIGVYTKELFAHLKKDTRYSYCLLSYHQDRSDFDLIHYPYFDMFFLTLPLRRNKPAVVTVHDLIPLKYPEKFPPGFRGTIKWKIQKKSLHSADSVITDSYASKQDILKFTEVKESGIHVVYLGVGNKFLPLQGRARAEELLADYVLPEKFLLHVGDVNYNKNIPALISAFSILHQSDPELKLILIGKGFLCETPILKEILQQISSLNLENDIYRFENLTTEVLVAFYNLAKVYVQPSLAEGFGLPVLEAFACGCPVVTSGGSSLAEITGKASVSVNPESVKDIADGVRKVLSFSDSQREKLKESGLRRAEEFTWEKCASKTISVYEKVLFSGNKTKNFQKGRK